MQKHLLALCRTISQRCYILVVCLVFFFGNICSFNTPVVSLNVLPTALCDWLTVVGKTPSTLKDAVFDSLRGGEGKGQ